MIQHCLKRQNYSLEESWKPPENLSDLKKKKSNKLIGSLSHCKWSDSRMLSKHGGEGGTYLPIRASKDSNFRKSFAVGFSHLQLMKHSNSKVHVTILASPVFPALAAVQSLVLHQAVRCREELNARANSGAPLPAGQEASQTIRKACLI